MERAQGRAKVIAINESIRLAPWADIWFGADYLWWQKRGLHLVSDAERVTIDRLAAKMWGLRLVRFNERPELNMRAGEVGNGGRHSGFYSLNLAVQFGAKRIILVGYDMVERPKGDTSPRHWHGDHADGLNNPTNARFKEWAEHMDKTAPVLRGLGVTVINTSPTSALEAYPKMTLAEALA